MAPAADTLRRTPLFDRHEAAGARLVPFAGWEMPVQYEGIRQEHVAVRTRRGVFDVSHMGEIEHHGPDAEDFLQRILSNDVTKIAERGAQYSVLCREDGGVLDDLFTYRLEGGALPDGHERLQPREATSPGSSEHAAGFDVAGATTPTPTSRCSPSRAREARAALERDRLQGEQPARMRTADLELAGMPDAASAAPATRARTAWSCCSRPTAPPPSGTR